METLQLQKKCGYIIYIKSIIASILGLITLFSGAFLCVTAKKISDTPLDPEATANCARGFALLMSTIAGFLYIIVGIIIVTLSILYWILGRKLIHRTTYQKKLLITGIVAEGICITSASEYLITSLFMIESWIIIVLIVFLLVFIIQAIYTIYLISKTMEAHKLENTIVEN